MLLLWGEAGMGLNWSSVEEKHGTMAWRDADSVG